MPRFNPLIFTGLDLTGAGGPSGAVQWKSPVTDESNLPMVGNGVGDARVVLATDRIYIWDNSVSKWVDTGLSLDAVGSLPNAEGAVLSTTNDSVGGVDLIRLKLQLEPADENFPGVLSTVTQSISGEKTFKNTTIFESSIDAQDLIDSSNGILNIGNAASSTQINIGDSSSSVDIQGDVTIDYSPSVVGDWSIVPQYVDVALDQLAERTTSLEQNQQVQLEPTGFPNRTDSIITFSDSSPDRTLEISPTGASFDFYVKGQKFTKTSAETIQLSAVSGDHYIYFDDNGNLQESTDPNFVKTIILEYAYVAVVYWNNDTSIHSYFGDERHGVVMDGATHSYLHTVFGARFISGLALQNFNTSTGYFNSDQGVIRDEDIVHTLSDTILSGIPILYRQGSLWRKKTAGAYPLIYPGSLVGYLDSTIPYNEYTGGSWQLTAVQNNKYVLVHFFATNDVDNGVVGIQGISQYDNMEAARNGANAEISSLSGLPFTEFVPIGTVLFQTNSGYASPTKGIIIPLDGANYIDFRGTQLYTPAGTATTHGLLSGLGNDDHFQYLLADGTRAMGGDLNMGTNQINNVVDGVLPTDAATVAQITNATSGNPTTFAGFDNSGILAEVPGWIFDDSGSVQVGAQNTLTVPPGTTDFNTIALSVTVSNPGLANLGQLQINPNITEDITNYNVIQAYGYGDANIDNYSTLQSQPNFTGTIENLNHISIDGSTPATNLTGVLYNSSSNSTNETGININSSGDATTFVGVSVSPTGDSSDFTGALISPSGAGATFVGLDVNGNSTYSSVTGLNVNLSGIVSTNRKVALNIENGTITQNAQYTTQSNLNVDSGNLLRASLEVQSGDPITNTDVILNNLSSDLIANDNHSSSGLGLGVSSVGFVGQVSVAGSKIVDSVSMATAGFAVPPSSANGTVTEAHLYRGVGPLNFGGSLNIEKIYGLKIENGLYNPTFVSQGAWGISVEDPLVNNYLAKSLIVGGPNKTTSNDEIALEIDGEKFLQLGKASTSYINLQPTTQGVLIYNTDDEQYYGCDSSGYKKLAYVSGPGDIPATSAIALDNQLSPADVTGLFFSSDSTLGFEATIYISRGSLRAQYKIYGFFRSSSYELNQEYIGDDVGINFTISYNVLSSIGQVQYTSSATGDNASLQFRAQTV